MRATIRDVAHKLNLSITTVSRAMDGYADVSAATRELVLKTAKEMGYTPNQAARQLRRKRSDTIGYIIPASGAGFADPFFSEFIAGLGDASAQYNYDILVTSASPEGQDESALYRRWVQEGKVDGMVLNRMRLDDWRPVFLKEQQIPFVSLERSLSQEDFTGVEVDSLSGMQELMKHLTGKGHRRIAYIGGQRQLLKIDYDRFCGYRSGLQAAKLAFDPALTQISDLSAGGGYQAMQNLLRLEDRPSAVVCINDTVATGAMHAVFERGLRAGEDIAVAGFDGVANSAHTQPPLTTLDQPVYQIAGQLAKMLIGLINGETPTPAQVKLKPALLIRPSTG